MPALASDLKLLKAAVLADLEDVAPKLALADCAEDAGDAGLAAGLRWCAAHRERGRRLAELETT
jgi:hypothetical protein